MQKIVITSLKRDLN